MKKEKYSIVLSGGGALGLAHIGVMDILKKREEIEIKEIIGTSMGAIIAAIYAAKKENKKEEIKSISEVLKWIKYDYTTRHLIKTDKIELILKKVFQEMKINETEIDLKIVATNFEEGTSYCFDKNTNITIVDAILTSMAIPGIFPEKEINGIKYVDGYLTSNLPVKYAKEKNIITSNVIHIKNIKEIKEKVFFKKTNNLLKTQEKAFKILILNQEKEEIRESLKKGHIIKELEPDINEYKTFQFNKMDELIIKGAEEALKKI
jgi:NTE family protein